MINCDCQQVVPLWDGNGSLHWHLGAWSLTELWPAGERAFLTLDRTARLTCGVFFALPLSLLERHDTLSGERSAGLFAQALGFRKIAIQPHEK